jgi:hypothetical protein
MDHSAMVTMMTKDSALDIVSKNYQSNLNVRP